MEKQETKKDLMEYLELENKFIDKLIQSLDLQRNRLVMEQMVLKNAIDEKNANQRSEPMSDSSQSSDHSDEVYNTMYEHIIQLPTISLPDDSDDTKIAKLVKQDINPFGTSYLPLIQSDGEIDFEEVDEEDNFQTNVTQN